MRLLLIALFGVASVAHAYPTDQFERTEIRRLKWQHAVDHGTARGTKTKPGAQWTSDRITLKLQGSTFTLTADTPKDDKLQAGLAALMKKNTFKNYGVALLDITDPTRPRYAGVDENYLQTPGSTAKILIAAALFDALKQRFGDDYAAREAFLKSVKVAADDWAMPNHHEIPVADGEKATVRRVLRGDTFSLWEWMDHALSPSSNAAASMLWREVTLMNLMGDAYPPAAYDDALFSRWDKATFSAAAFAAIDKPLLDAGLSPETFNLRLFFTKGPSKYIAGEHSRVSPLALVQWMLAVEQGRMVDAWSSLELKRLLYLTRRRVRYAKAPELNDAAVFFKSGSLFKCKPEEGYTCIQYQGNEVNVLNALVEVETPPPAPKQAPEGAAAPQDAAAAQSAPPRVYIVAVMSNELKKNAADDHMRLASAIHRLIEETAP